MGSDEIDCFQMLENCFDFYISARILRNFRVDFSKTSVGRLYAQNLWQMIIQLNHQLGETKSKNRSCQDIYSMVFGVNDA